MTAKTRTDAKGPMGIAPSTGTGGREKKKTHCGRRSTRGFGRSRGKKKKMLNTFIREGREGRSKAPEKTCPRKINVASVAKTTTRRNDNLRKEKRRARKSIERREKTTDTTKMSRGHSIQNRINFFRKGKRWMEREGRVQPDLKTKRKKGKGETPL